MLLLFVDFGCVVVVCFLFFVLLMRFDVMVCFCLFFVVLGCVWLLLFCD